MLSRVHGIGEGLADLCTQHPRELLKHQLQVGIHGDQMCLDFRRNVGSRYQLLAHRRGATRERERE
jgi:hypothetical protein